MKLVRRVSLNGGVYWVRKEEEDVKYIMSDGDHRSVEELCDDDLVDELCHSSWLHDTHEKSLALEHELKKRLSQDNLDTKALEMACEVLSELGQRKECKSCYSKAPTRDHQGWLNFLRQQAGEE